MLTIDGRNEFSMFKEGLFDFPLMYRAVHIEAKMTLLSILIFEDEMRKIQATLELTTNTVQYTNTKYEHFILFDQQKK